MGPGADAAATQARPVLKQVPLSLVVAMRNPRHARSADYASHAAMSVTHRMLFVLCGLTMVQSMTQRPPETQSLLVWLLIQALVRELVQA